MNRLGLTALCLLVAAACGPARGQVTPLRPTLPATRAGMPTLTLTRLPTGTTAAAATASPTPPASVTRRPTATPFFGQVSIPNATITYYTIAGSTAEALRAQMSAKGLVDEAGDQVDALTEWYISWHWPGIGRRLCNLAAAKVAYNIQVTLPRWDPPAAVSPELRTRWADYIAAVALHERGHVQYIVTHYRLVETAIQDATCLSADAAAQAVLADFRAFDLEYDAVTHHGATQGAVFP